MKAVVLTQPGSPQGLTLKNVPVPKLRERDVLVKVRASGVCYHDVVVAQGILRRGIKDNPILGHEIAGEVIEVGPSVRNISTGDRVVSILTEICGDCTRCLTGNEHRCLNGHGIGHSIDGGYAESVRLHELSLRQIPEGVSFEQASVCSCPIGVALRAIRYSVKPKLGESAVVTGATGGLGIHAVQILKQSGVRVFSVTTSPEKLTQLETFGTDDIIFSPDMEFHWEVLAATEDQGVEIVFDTVGSASFEPSFQALAQYGRIVFVGEIAGQEVKLNPANLLFKDAQLIGSSGVGKKDLDDALELVRQGLIKPVVTSFRLDQAAEIHQMLLNRELFGRAVLIP